MAYRTTYVLFSPFTFGVASIGFKAGSLEMLLDHPSAPSLRVATLNGVIGEIAAVLYDALDNNEIGAYELDTALSGFLRDAYERGETR